MHGQDAYYETEALVAGSDMLTEEEDSAVRAAVGDVAGLDVLHLQCHIGFDSISLARRGARVTGVDFSPASLEKAGPLAERCGVEIEWVEADATELPASLHGRFNLVYATIGVLCWIDDVRAWMRSVHAALRPGGHLALVDGHPLAAMIGTSQPLTFDFPYANDGGRRVDDQQGSYADPGAEVPETVTVQYAHSLGETVTAAIRAGLHVDALIEHLDASFEHLRDIATLEDDGRWRLRVDGEPLPLLFTLLATRRS